MNEPGAPPSDLTEAEADEIEADCLRVAEYLCQILGGEHRNEPDRAVKRLLPQWPATRRLLFDAGVAPAAIISPGTMRAIAKTLRQCGFDDQAARIETSAAKLAAALSVH